MLKRLRQLREQAGRFRDYTRLFRLRDALALIRNQEQPGELTVYSRELKRPLTVRRVSSDLPVVLKVLGAHEYEIHQPIAPKLIIDAGANIGVSALYFAHKYQQARIYAIEPEASNYALLRANCAMVPNIIPRQAALWSHRTRVDLADPDADKWAFSVREHPDGCGEVPTTTILNMLEEAGQPMIDILKLDIEGAERQLFSPGCAQWLDRVRLIVIELHDRFVPGCSRAFYRAIAHRNFSQEVRGENVVVMLNPAADPIVAAEISSSVAAEPPNEYAGSGAFVSALQTSRV